MTKILVKYGNKITLMILSFQTDMPGQTVQAQIRLLLEEEQSDLGLHCVCHSVCIVQTHYSMVEPHSSNFRVIFGVSEYLGNLRYIFTI